MEYFNENEQLFNILDEVFDEFKYETLRFILEWKNTKQNFREIMRIRDMPHLKTFFLTNKKKAMKNCFFIIDFLKSDESEENNPNMQLIKKTTYKSNNEERICILANGFPDFIEKTHSLDENYFKIVRKSIKRLTQKPKKLFSNDFPLIVSMIKTLENMNLFESLKMVSQNKIIMTLEQFFKFKEDTIKSIYQIDKVFFKIEVIYFIKKISFLKYFKRKL